MVGMARKPALRSVTPDEKAPAKIPSSVSDAVKEGTSRDQLVAMRTRIAKAIDDPNIRGADLASLSRRLLEISRELEAIDAREQGDDVGAAAEVPGEAFDPKAL